MSMWFDNLPEGSSWASLWSGYVLCGGCSGIRKVTKSCPACGAPVPAVRQHVVRLADGCEHIVSDVFMGAEARYEDWVYLRMLEREWKRPLTDADRFLDVSESARPSARAPLVLIFWSYFETRIDRLLREGMRAIGSAIQLDLLRRYATVGSRIDRLYRLVFNSTYWLDLHDLGFDAVASLLRRVQEKRNQFAHGQPAAIDDKLVSDLVAALQYEHEAWIAVFNKRAVKQSTP